MIIWKLSHPTIYDHLKIILVFAVFTYIYTSCTSWNTAKFITELLFIRRKTLKSNRSAQHEIWSVNRPCISLPLRQEFHEIYIVISSITISRSLFFQYLFLFFYLIFWISNKTSDAWFPSLLQYECNKTLILNNTSWTTLIKFVHQMIWQYVFNLLK